MRNRQQDLSMFKHSPRLPALVNSQLTPTAATNLDANPPGIARQKDPTQSAHSAPRGRETMAGRSGGESLGQHWMSAGGEGGNRNQRKRMVGQVLNLGELLIQCMKGA